MGTDNRAWWCTTLGSEMCEVVGPLKSNEWWSKPQLVTSEYSVRGGLDVGLAGHSIGVGAIFLLALKAQW